MQHREVRATTGTGLRVRLFAGWNLAGDEVTRPDFDRHG
jgi:hypothetical protein